MLITDMLVVKKIERNIKKNRRHFKVFPPQNLKLKPQKKRTIYSQYEKPNVCCVCVFI